jgi:putative ATP-grasp target RiPP
MADVREAVRFHPLDAPSFPTIPRPARVFPDIARRLGLTLSGTSGARREERKKRMTAAVAGVPDADPFAPTSAQFALDGASFTSRRDDVASPAGVRPWGLRRALPAGAGRVLPNWTYDNGQQKAVDATGRPVIELPVAGDPSASTTSTVDGEDGPSAEDWNND